MQSINLNLIPGSFQQVFNCSQGDIGRQLTAKLFDGSTAYEIPAGSTVKIKATKPSGFGFDESATFSGSTVTITTAETMTNEWGRFPAELVITKDGNVIGTANFLFNIEKNPHPDSTVDGDAEEVIPELTLLVERVEAAASSVLDMEVVATTLPAGSQASYSYDEDLNKATFGIPQGEAGAGAAGVVASAYSSSKTYKVGDYVIHNSNLYRCITAITTAEAFTAAHWTQIVLADDVSDLKSDLQAIKQPTKNLADPNLYAKNGITYGNDVIEGTGSAFNGAEFPFVGEENTQYRISFDIKTNGSPTSSGTGLRLKVHFTDGTEFPNWIGFANNQTEYTHYSVSTTANKTVDKILWTIGSGLSNTWYLKDFQIEKGTTETDYINPYSAKDLLAEQKITQTNEDIRTVAKELEKATDYGFAPIDFELGNISIGSSGWSYSDSYTRVRTKQGITISLKEGDIIGLTDYSNARFYLGWLKSDETYGYRGWLTSDYMITEDGDYVILLCNTADTTQANKNALLNLLFIKRHQGRKSIYSLPLFNRSGMRLHAHRGLIDTDPTSDYVENSIPSFELAGKNQMYVCETDLCITSDGHFVCMHDGTVDRTTNGTGSVSSMTLEQIRALRLLKKNGDVSDLLVPTFEEYLSVCKRYNMIACVEIKGYTGAQASAVMGIIKDYGMENQSYMAIAYQNVRSVRILTKLDIPLFIIATDDTWTNCYNTALEYDYTGITYNSEDTITQAKVESCHENGIPFDVWVANTVASADDCFDIGIDIITTDILKPSDWLV